MIDVNGKPFVLYVVEDLKKSGITEIVFCLGYLAESFKDYFGDGSRFGVSISYSVEEEFLGTAGALKLAEDRIGGDFFVLNGDTYLPINYAGLYDKFRASGRTAMMVVYDNSEKVAEPNIEIGPEGEVTAYFKKEALKAGDRVVKVKAAAKRDYRYVDAGVYLLKKDVLNMIAKGKFVSLEADVWPQLISKGQLASYVTSNRYYDLGTPERLELIRKVLK